MNQSLFRTEALFAQSDRVHGHVAVGQPFRYQLLVGIVSLILLAVILFLVFGEYARRQAAAGAVTASIGSVRVQSRFAGIIEQIKISEGQLVKAGDVVVVFNNQRVNDDNHDIDQQLLLQLQATLTELDLKLVNAIKTHDLDLNRRQEQVLATRKDVVTLTTQLKTEQEKLQLVEARKRDFDALRSKGFISDVQSKDQQQLWLEARSRVDELQRVLSKQESQLKDLQFQLQQLPTQHLSQLADLRNQRAEINQRLIEIEARRAFAVAAPVTGRVTALQVKPGQTVTPQTVLMTIVPENAEFEAELFVPTRAIGFVREGQTVYLRYQAFPYQRYGLYEGKIKTIAKAILTPQEIVSAVPLSNEPFYRVVVSLNQQQVQAYGQQFELQSGMLLDADIVLDRRPIWQWLLEPVLSLRGRV